MTSGVRSKVPLWVGRTVRRLAALAPVAWLVLGTSTLGVSLGFAATAFATGPDPAIDDFERASLGGDWTRLGGTSAEIVGDRDLGVLNTGGCAVGWAATTFQADQFSEAVIAQDKPPNMLTQVYVRLRAIDNARHGFHFNGDPGNARWEIKFDGVPTAQTRILASVPGSPPGPGDTLRLDIFGTTLHGYRNGQLLLTAIDTNHNRIIGTGMTGVVARNAQGSTNTPPTPIFASWAGGSLDPGLDPDGDGIYGSNDNCPSIANPDQANVDGDARGNACDCAPADAGAFAAPPEIQSVSFSVDGETLTWASAAATAGSGTVYDLYREQENGRPAGSSPEGICLAPGAPQPSWTDLAVPPAGDAWRYLVRGRNACAPGTWGVASDGSSRQVGDCP